MPDTHTAAPTATCTARLLLRAPTPDDYAAACTLHCDPQTHRFNPNGPDSRAGIHGKLQEWIEHWHRHGFGYWAVCERAQPARVLGFGGIMHRPFGARSGLNLYFRFAVDAWGRGYANEMGRAALQLAFEELHQPQVIGLVRADNLPSRRALERLGLTRDGELDDFPGLPPSLLYSLSADTYFATSGHPPDGSLRP